jgi:hypothetical protein
MVSHSRLLEELEGRGREEGGERRSTAQIADEQKHAKENAFGRDEIAAALFG